MTPAQALLMLYSATRRLALPAEDHEKLRAAAATVEQALEEKKDGKDNDETKG